MNEILSPYPPLDETYSRADGWGLRPADWDPRQRDVHAAWVKRCTEQRGNVLPQYLGLDPSSPDSVQLCDDVGRRLAEIFVAPRYYTVADGADPFGRPEQGVVLTGESSAIAFDLGFFLAKRVLSDFSPPLRWAVEKRARHSLFYNVPRIAGFAAKWLDFDPLHVAATMTHRLARIPAARYDALEYYLKAQDACRTGATSERR